MKTLLLNPPSFENFDGGASSRYQATREITSFWYPVWLAYPAGLIEESRLLDAPSHGVSPEETVRIAGAYDFVVIFTSTPGFRSDARLAEMIKAAKPGIRIAFVGPHVSIKAEESLKVSAAIDFVARKEFDYSVAEFAWGRRLEEIQGVSFRKNGAVFHNPDRPPLEDLDGLPFAVDIYKRDLDITRYNIPYLRHPYVSFYTSRGCPAQCTFCLWPQTMSGHLWRTRSTDNVIAEVKRALGLFPEAREIFFDDDTFTWRKSRVLELCGRLKTLGFTWSCNSRVTADYETLKAMTEAGCRLLIVGFESGDPDILRNIKKGATVEQARAFMKHCKRLGLTVHGDFQIGHPGETRESIKRTMRFARELDPETIQVSISHPYPGTEFYDYLEKHRYLTAAEMTDELGHQLPNIQYPGLSREEIVEAVEDFYARYYFRPRIVFRIVRRALFDAQDRKRLYREAKEFFQLRAKRKSFLKTRSSG
ncbi:MAG: hopanoid biosynthesis associated radical SAM protein HpnJ [Nitrospirae bacterium]|nr:hopanoid biosynthesis associated radical SAM protein HpnJ [Nitrospirota bacterium]